MRVVVAISGGIAAYKAPLLIRLFVKNGCEVKVVATKNALQFVTETTLRLVSKHPVYKDMFLSDGNIDIEHISIADWADVFVVAPATANIIGKYANGIADDVVSTTLLAFTKQVFFAPAMNTNMYYNPAVQKNIHILSERGVKILYPVSGELACGYVGDGKMLEPDAIFNAVVNEHSISTSLMGKNVLVTAGSTYEKIDAVRFIGNHSTGKMGFAIVQALVNAGANVKLIAGHSTATLENNPKIERINVETAEEMFEKTTQLFPSCDIAILSAAVSDYAPVEIFDKKLKKSNQPLNITFKPTKDILAALGKMKTKYQILVGFALETDNELENAKKKLKNKKLDFIVLNSLKDEGAGFAIDTNKITIIDISSNIIEYPLKTKKEVAKDIVSYLIEKVEKVV
ncbi:MAG: bifunctional phosphopantothenoylcysteine decarboxylase/phosphopantothenate--cysteine ligase CoaBC [Bacteroidales bacterium]|jgi:phosphopantothenoylcysteine decarboxylase/phosphopantothenate--cysteine ligase|nr:bifunctional phosphopantothenoylcysteine decarboxylase/phosphopantothenate--cysteine ligase CoaBC [Bacteroidales bacterium]